MSADFLLSMLSIKIFFLPIVIIQNTQYYPSTGKVLPAEVFSIVTC